MKYLGRWWNSRGIQIYEIEGRKIALYGWNGIFYTDCFEVTDDLLDVKNDEKIRVTPICQETDNGEWEVIDYGIMGGE